MGKAILELVKSPHEIHKGLEEFKKKGVIKNAVTVADLADKLLGIRNAIVKVSYTVIRRFAAGMVEKAAEDTGPSTGPTSPSGRARSSRSSRKSRRWPA